MPKWKVRSIPDWRSPIRTTRRPSSAFYFTDTSGTNLGSGSFELGEHEQTARFLNQEPFNEALPDGSPVLGTFTFESSVPIAVIALRGFTNEAGEFLMTTLSGRTPVAGF